MNEIAKVVLENEMDLILAHKQTMRLAELTGLSLPAQTTFATAVSELSRNSIEQTKDAILRLFVSNGEERYRYIIAIIQDSRTDYSEKSNEGYRYAQRLVPHIKATTTDNDTQVELRVRMPLTTRVDEAMLEKWRVHLNHDPAVSPYEEIKRKNRQLSELANKLKESELQYKTLTNSLPILIYTVKETNEVSFVNDWLVKYTGRTKEELTQSRWEDIIHRDDYGRFAATVRKAREEGHRIIDMEFRLLEHKTGEYKWHKGIATALANDKGEVTCWNNYLVDIQAQKMIEQAYRDNTELKRTQRALEDKVEELNNSNRQLEQFAYIASHDLQEPLRKISYYSDVLSGRYRDVLGTDGVTLFDNMVRSTERMKMLIHDVLAYSSINDKQDFSQVDLNTVLQEALSDLEIAIHEKHAIIRYDVLPTIDGNPLQLKQVFENLLSNSLKFVKPDVTPEIFISASVDNNSVTLSFKDNGIGFDEAYLGRMFDLFQRLHPRQKYEGTGIGLAICKKILTLHNGTISGHSKEGYGATFVINLPLKQY